MKTKILAFFFQEFAPWYANKFAKYIAKLPHEKQCACNTGPYQCNCAKREIRRNLLYLIKDDKGVLDSPNFKEVER